MKDIKKTYNMDGLPGVTLPGVTGPTGERGSDSVVLENDAAGSIVISDIGSFTIKAAPEGYIPKVNDTFILRSDGSVSMRMVTSVTVRGDMYICTCIALDSISNNGTVGDDGDSDIVVEISGSTLPYKKWDGISVIAKI